MQMAQFQPQALVSDLLLYQGQKKQQAGRVRGPNGPWYCQVPCFLSWQSFSIFHGFPKNCLKFDVIGGDSDVYSIYRIQWMLPMCSDLRLPPSPSTKSATNLGSFAEGDEEDDS